MLGWYHMQRAFAASVENKEHAFSEFTYAGEYYRQATTHLPTDDEMFAYYLTVAVEAHWHCNKPLKNVLPLVAQITFSFKKSSEIWQNSPMSSFKNEHIGQALTFGLDCQMAFQNGRITMEDIVKPAFMVRIDASNILRLL